MRRPKQGLYVYVCPKCGAETSTDVPALEVAHVCRNNKNKRTVFERKDV